MMDELKFQQRAVDHPGTVTCPHCAAVVDLPTSDPWLLMDGEAIEPQLESLPCPQCRTRIYLLPVSDERRAKDAELDALPEDES